MARVDRQTETKIQPEYFSDFAIDFSKNPITGELSRLTNENSVKQSIKLLVLTTLGEWPHANDLGCQVSRLLFEPADSITLSNIKRTVQEVINNYEKRAVLHDVTVLDDADNNQYQIYIVFSLRNTNRSITLSVILKRVR